MTSEGRAGGPAEHSGRPALPPGPFLVVGLGRSGVAVARLLAQRGEQVVACDAGSPDVTALRDVGVDVHLQTTGEDLVGQAGTVVKSPGVRAEAPAPAAALTAGVPVVGELEIAWRLLPNRFIAVTGTNGKTTTSELIGHLFATANVPVEVAGNVGTALSSIVGSVGPDATIVCEASSFQLEDAEWFAPDVAVLVNLGEDHLDRHGTVARYREAKLRVFAHQRVRHVAVAPCDLARGALPGAARRLCFGADPDADVALRENALWWGQERLLGVDEVPLRGAHNLENAMAAATACLAAGIDADAIRTGLRTFPGVPHRLEEVGERGGVLYVNDSKATNPASTVVALRSFAPGTVHLILGGQGKGQSYDVLREPVEQAVSAVYLIGDEAPALAEALDGVAAPVEQSATLEGAIAATSERAKPGEVVLLSPACASFDQFADFEDRGERFRALVQALAT
jgi:UDP-N-acetylmuramoylalanine--D-glutamate ligase